MSGPNDTLSILEWGDRGAMRITTRRQDARTGIVDTEVIREPDCYEEAQYPRYDRTTGNPIPGSFRALYRYRNEQHHCDDGPDSIQEDGSLTWSWHGIPHRDGGPARILADGTLSWYREGMPCRTEMRGGKQLPAVIHGNGSVEYWGVA